jgi:hypothetical protein
MENTKYSLNKILEQYDFKSDKKLQELLQIQKEISSEDMIGLSETYKLEDIILKLCAIENIQRLKIKVRDEALDGSSNIINRCENTISKQKTLIESLERTNKLASVLLQYNTLRTDKLKSRIKVLGFALAVVVGFALVLAFKAFL